MKLLLLPLKHRQRIPQAFRSLSWGAKKEDASKKKDGSPREREESDDADTFASANSSELRSSSRGIDDDSQAPSFRLSPPPIFPTGSVERPPPASPVKIVRKLPFGYVIGRQLDAPALQPPPSVTTLSRNVKTVVMPLMAWLHLRSRSLALKKKAGRAFKKACQRGSRRDEREGVQETDDGCCGNDDEDVFWKKDVKGLRCRQVQDDDAPY
ncbi:hypothetical protein Zm00014a_012612 [Zea mays]|uniref:Uncharacterized protein n=1 Tax=Zea mays TaxID=4577 RepID=A0A3L6ED57_MAIZE|nr:hypothetical protein Zm00014a_012612 [Zea mays]